MKNISYNLKKKFNRILELWNHTYTHLDKLKNPKRNKLKKSKTYIKDLV